MNQRKIVEGKLDIEKTIKEAIQDSTEREFRIPVPERQRDLTEAPAPSFHPSVKKEPRKEDTRIKIYLGRNTKTRRPVYWNPYSITPTKLTNQHILMVGKSGAGKTQSVLSFIDKLAGSNVPSIIFDFQGEYTDRKLTNADGKTFVECTNAKVIDAAEGIDFNPLEVPIDPISGEKRSFMKVVYQISDSLAQIFDLGDIQTAILQSSIYQAFIDRGFIAKDKKTWSDEPPTMAELWNILQSYDKTSDNLVFRIKPLFENDIFVKNEMEPWDLFEKTQILKLSNLATSKLMLAVSQFVLQKIYMTMLSKGTYSDLRLFVVIDEAHKLAFNETISNLIREGRKYGVGLLLASQSVVDFDPIILNMAGTKIAFQLGSDDVSTIVRNMGFSKKEETDKATQLILYQRPFQALIASNHFEPFVQANMIPFFKTK